VNCPDQSAPRHTRNVQQPGSGAPTFTLPDGVFLQRRPAFSEVGWKDKPGERPGGVPESGTRTGFAGHNPSTMRVTRMTIKGRDGPRAVGPDAHQAGVPLLAPSRFRRRMGCGQHAG
jgi:hypothetical protein